MTRKVIIDCDPGIDDAVALCAALFAPNLHVLAVTATEGCVAAEQSTKNLQAIIEQIDPPRLPRIGCASPADNAPAVDARYLHGDDGLGNTFFDVSSLQHRHPSEKVIGDVIRANPGEVTFIALGPLTNLARALQRDPSLTGMVDRIVMMGGSTNGIGNITPAAEFNIHYDPISAQAIFRSLTTKTLIPLDVTRQVFFNINLLKELPGPETNVGGFLRKTIPYVFRSYHQRLGQESINLNDAIALLAVIDPELFETEEMAGEVETVGEMTRGVTVFDRRPQPDWRPNMEVATLVDAAKARDRLLSCLRLCGSHR